MTPDNTSLAYAVKALVPLHWKRGLQERLLRLRIRHVFGPKYVHLDANEAAVTCVVRNGEFYVNSFVEHHSQIGFRHIFFLDNGSTDNTISLAKKHRNVTLYQCGLPVGAYQGVFKKCLANIAVPTGWCLDADIDEYFDYPFSDLMGMSKFLEYLNERGYSAVLAQMLDMFSDRPLATLAQKTRNENLKDIYRFYDLSQVRKVCYRSAELARTYAPDNQLANKNTELYFGGIRKMLFGLNCLLSKHSLFRTGASLSLFPHVHFVNNAHIADVSCVLLHYKLVSHAYDSASQNSRAFPAISQGYEDLMHLIESKPGRHIRAETAVEFNTAAELLENNFLFLSSDYRQYAGATHYRATGAELDSSSRGLDT